MSQKKLNELLDSARQAQKRSYSPYSKFAVGAALEGDSGRIYTGCNIENSSYGLTVCAERVAVFKAVSEGETRFTRLVVYADTEAFCPPCGACRQVLVDFAPGLEVILLNATGATRRTTLAELLPEAFDRQFLDTGRKPKP